MNSSFPFWVPFSPFSRDAALLNLWGGVSTNPFIEIPMHGHSSFMHLRCVGHLRARTTHTSGGKKSCLKVQNCFFQSPSFKVEKKILQNFSYFQQKEMKPSSTNYQSPKSPKCKKGGELHDLVMYTHSLVKFIYGPLPPKKKVVLTSTSYFSQIFPPRKSNLSRRTAGQVAEILFVLPGDGKTQLGCS